MDVVCISFFVETIGKGKNNVNNYKCIVMKVLGSPICDKRINCKNYLLEMTIKEYYDISQDILKNNEYQRKRVKSSSTIYSLLKDDLMQGCIMPPIVLALAKDIKSDEDVIEIINNNKKDVIILDGLQRSFTIRDLIKDLDNNIAENEVLNNPIRIELYAGINKYGVLYRMLTYNTGQTQMSTRHQIEIIYSDYIDTVRNGVKFIREIDDSAPRSLGEYRFIDVVNGFTSYLERDYLSLERIDILNSIRSLQELTKEDPKAEIFDVFIEFYHIIVKKINEASNNWIADKDKLGVESVFANNVIGIFNRSQSMTGFGAALGKMIDQNIFQDIVSIKTQVENSEFENVIEGLDLFILKMDIVRNNAKKIGNDQRLFFYHFYRGLFLKDSDSFMNIKRAVDYAYRQYERETM